MSSNLFFRRGRGGNASPVSPDAVHMRHQSSTEDARPPNLRFPEFRPDSFTDMQPEDIIRLQTSNTKLVTDNIQLSNELAVMQQQNEELENYLRQVSDISKVHAQEVVKKAQKIEELQRAVEFKTRQVDELREQQGQSHFGSSDLETTTVIPLHLRDKFQGFLQQILMDQRRQFIDGMQLFIASEQIDGDDRMALMESIARVGTSVTKDYATELELRLVGAMNTEDEDQTDMYASIPGVDAKENGDYGVKEPPKNLRSMMLHKSETSRVRFSMAVNQGDLSDTDTSVSGSDEDGEELDLTQDAEANEMLSMMRQMSMANIQMDQKNGIIRPQHSYTANGSDDWQAQLLELKKNMERPPHAPAPFTVNNDTPYIELRDMLDALPYELAKSILMEQDATQNQNDRIRDVILQRGQWPLVRFSNNRQVKITNAPPFQMCLERLEKYLSVNESQSDSESGATGRGLQSVLDPQNRTGYRLHMVTAIVRNRNETPTPQITALNFRIGRMWTANLRAVLKQVKFWSSLEKPASLLVLGPPTSEKCALMREITRQVSLKFRAALVDTRSAVGGFSECPLECGCAVRFFVNAVGDQSSVIEGTRSIFPQVVVVDEVLSADDISSLERLQSEGISVIAGTNTSSLHALLAHPVFSHLLPPQHRINETREQKKYSSISPHLLILQLDYDGTKLSVFKNIPEAVEAIKRDTHPQCDEFDLQWAQWDDHQQYFERMRHGKHKYLAGFVGDSLAAMDPERSISRGGIGRYG